jgi:hypothetical protein
VTSAVSVDQLYKKVQENPPKAETTKSLTVDFTIPESESLIRVETQQESKSEGVDSSLPSSQPLQNEPSQPISSEITELKPAAALPASSEPEAGSILSGAGELPLIGIAGGVFAAFVVGTFLMRGREVVEEKDAVPAPAAVTPPPSPTVVSSESDVAVPYDAAARLAYDQWRADNQKGNFDESKFLAFKKKYIEITSANMAAKKVARDTGGSITLLTLGPDADQ